MWCHMERLPQRPAIIDSPQRCTQLGTFTNKGRPININHAVRAGDSEGWRERARKPSEGNKVPPVWFSIHSFTVFPLASCCNPYLIKICTLYASEHLFKYINTCRPLPSGLIRPPSVHPTVTPTTYPEVLSLLSHTHTHFSRLDDSLQLDKGGVNELCLTSVGPNRRAAVIYCCCPHSPLPGGSHSGLPRPHTASYLIRQTGFHWAFCKNKLTENISLWRVNHTIIF